jgi:hypothetical protein
LKITRSEASTPSQHSAFSPTADEFHQSSGFVLEVMVVVILIIDLLMLFRGKH